MLVRPVVSTVISSSQFGQPISDFVTANTPTAWVPVTFTNAWANYDDATTPVEYRKIGGMVYVRGRMTGGAIGSPAFRLPVGFRPPHFVDHATACYALIEVELEEPPPDPLPDPIYDYVSAFGTVDSGGFYLPIAGSNLQWSMALAFAVAP